MAAIVCRNTCFCQVMDGAMPDRDAVKAQIRAAFAAAREASRRFSRRSSAARATGAASIRPSSTGRPGSRRARSDHRLSRAQTRGRRPHAPRQAVHPRGLEELLETMTPFDLSGKAALVTGGNGGIGLGMALGLARAGAAVAIAGRNEDKNAAAVQELKKLGAKAIAMPADVSNEVSCRAMVQDTVERLGALHILVNNAGINI